SALPPPPQRWDRFLAAEVPNISSYEELKDLSSSEYVTHQHALVREVIISPGYRDPETNVISNTAWKRLVDGGLLAASFGDRDPATRQIEIMEIGRMLSFYDISLGLTYGITTALAIMPIQRFGSPEQQEKYLGMIRDGKRIGLAITERNQSGSTLKMDSYYEKDNETTHINFAKMWQGLTGNIEDMPALIVTAKDKDSKEEKPTIGIFIIDQDDIHSVPLDMNVLDGIFYGDNTGDAIIDTKMHLMKELTFLRLLEYRDLFTVSRFFFVGMTLGHQEMTDYEAQKHSDVFIGNTRQADMEVPQIHLQNIRARTVILDAIFRQTAAYRKEGNSLLNTNTISYKTEAAIIKVLSAEYAYDSADNRVTLGGASSFVKNGAQQDADNIRPFRTFEGAEDMLYSDIG
ncbi:MAG: acyl-CoA dehydrogenase family protein, partial [Nanoarchaeota archaeon]|nr:acyl-CoA dehydrogenase family protein [Nanoarchaeota archaeon]